MPRAGEADAARGRGRRGRARPHAGSAAGAAAGGGGRRGVLPDRPCRPCGLPVPAAERGTGGSARPGAGGRSGRGHVGRGARGERRRPGRAGHPWVPAGAEGRGGVPGEAPPAPPTSRAPRRAGGGSAPLLPRRAGRSGRCRARHGGRRGAAQAPGHTALGAARVRRLLRRRLRLGLPRLRAQAAWLLPGALPARRRRQRHRAARLQRAGRAALPRLHHRLLHEQLHDLPHGLPLRPLRHRRGPPRRHLLLHHRHAARRLLHARLRRAALPGHVTALGGRHPPHPHQHAGGQPLREAPLRRHHALQRRLRLLLCRLPHHQGAVRAGAAAAHHVPLPGELQRLAPPAHALPHAPAPRALPAAARLRLRAALPAALPLLPHRRGEAASGCRVPRGRPAGAPARATQGRAGVALVRALRALGALRVARGLALEHAAAALPLHRHAQPAAPPPGPRRPRAGEQLHQHLRHGAAGRRAPRALERPPAGPPQAGPGGACAWARGGSAGGAARDRALAGRDGGAVRALLAVRRRARAARAVRHLRAAGAQPLLPLRRQRRLPRHRHFGKLYGLAMALSALVALLQYPCVALVRGPLHGNPFYVNVALVAVVLLALGSPLAVRRECRRRQRELEAAAGTALATPG